MDNEFKNNELVQYIYQKVFRKLQRLGIEFTSDDIYDEIDNAFEAINSRRHFNPTPSILIEDKYKNMAYELCIASMVKEGAEGEKTHAENGITRNYGSTSYPEDILKRIVPLARFRG
jgi:hypothetical protein